MHRRWLLYHHCYNHQRPKLSIIEVQLKISLLRYNLPYDHHNFTSAIVFSLFLHWSPFDVEATESLLHFVSSSAAAGFGFLVLSFLLIAFCTIGSCVNLSESGSSLNDTWWSFMLSSSPSIPLFTVPKQLEIKNYLSNSKLHGYFSLQYIVSQLRCTGFCITISRQEQWPHFKDGTTSKG